MYPLILTARICIRFSIHNRSCYEAPFDPMHLYPKHVSLIRQWFRARLWCYRTGVTTVLHLSHHHCLRESPVLVAGFTTLHTKGAWKSIISFPFAPRYLSILMARRVGRNASQWMESICPRGTTLGPRQQRETWRITTISSRWDFTISPVMTL